MRAEELQPGQRVRVPWHLVALGRAPAGCDTVEATVVALPYDPFRNAIAARVKVQLPNAPAPIAVLLQPEDLLPAVPA